MTVRTTYRKDFKQVPFEYYTKERLSDGDIKLVGWGTYGSSSVLAGQAMKNAIAFFKTEAELDEALQDAGVYPADVHWSNQWMEPVTSFNHLSDEGDY